jgi:hypothetical protein
MAFHEEMGLAQDIESARWWFRQPIRAAVLTLATSSLSRR